MSGPGPLWFKNLEWNEPLRLQWPSRMAALWLLNV